MTTEEQNYHDYIVPGGDATLTAESYARVITNDPSISPEEINYRDYRNLASVDEEEADYAVFSSMFDIVPLIEHPSYESAFEIVGHSLMAKCKRKKTPD